MISTFGPMAVVVSVSAILLYFVLIHIDKKYSDLKNELNHKITERRK